MTQEQPQQEQDHVTITETIPYIYEFRSSDLSPLTIHQDASGQGKFGNGATVWDTSLVLGRYLEKHPDLIKDKVVVELGSGTGMLGLIMQKLGAKKVVCTDKEWAMPLLTKNTEPQIDAAILEWGNEEQAKVNVLDKLESDIDLIVLSDCIFWPELYESLVASLRSLAIRSTPKILLGFERRNFEQEIEFFRSFGKYFRFRDIKPDEMDPEYYSEDIYVFLGEPRENAGPAA